MMGGTVAPQATPAGPPIGATGGYALPQALGAIQPLSTFEVRVDSRTFTTNSNINIDLPRVGYLKSIKIVVKGTLTNTPGTGTITAGDPRNIISQMALVFQGINRVRALSGIGENVIDGLDFPVLAPKQTFSATTGAQTFYMEWTMMLPVSETNLLGVLYVGGGSTYPQLQITSGAENQIVTLTGNATSVLSAATIDTYVEWIDAPAPAPPRTVTVQGKQVTYPPKGLWRETLNMKQTQVLTTQVITSPNSQTPIELPRGPVYSRIVLVAFWGGVVDASDQLLIGCNLDVQQITGIGRATNDLFDMRHRQVYFKTRPGGIYVFTFIDKTSSDRDLLYTSQLGKFTLTPLGSAATPPANSYVQVLTETLVPLQSPGVI